MADNLLPTDLSSTQIAELYFYNLNSRIMRQDPLTGSYLHWFDTIPIHNKKLLLDNLDQLRKTLDKMPDLDSIPLEKEVEAWMLKREERLKASLEKIEEHKLSVEKGLGETPEDRVQVALDMIKEGKVEELLKKLGKQPNLDM